MEPEAAAAVSSTATNVVWMLRIMLPVLLFVLWYRLQAPASTGGKCCYQRDVVLAARRSTRDSGDGDDDDDDGIPESLHGLRLVDEATAQRLLGLPPPRVSGSGAGGNRRDARGPRQKPGAERGRLSSEGRRSGELADLGELPEAEPGAGGAEAAAEPAAVAQGLARLTREELAQHTALLSFMAFGHGGRQQRSFLHDEQHPPPPPPRAAQLSPEAGAAPRANADAQTVLRGLVNAKAGLRSAEVPRRLHRQLQDAHVHIDATTFALLVEASAGAGDLQAASDLLMKMEVAGHCAGSELLDMVMDLYAEGGGTRPGAAGIGSWADTEDGDGL